MGRSLYGQLGTCQGDDKKAPQGSQERAEYRQKVEVDSEELARAAEGGGRAFSSVEVGTRICSSDST